MRLKAVLAAIAFLLLASLAITYHAVAKLKGAASSQEPAQLVSIDSTQDVLETQVVLIELRPTGFTPRELVLPAGNYLVVARNRTGLDQFALRLNRANSEVLFDVTLPRYKRDWKQLLSLTPGVYVVSETRHPDWQCRITVTSR